MWIIYALAASFFWGITYVLSEQIFKKISVLSALGITTLISSVFVILLAASTGILNKDIATILSSRTLKQLLFAEILVLIIAELMIGFSITAKNATLAGLVEISYPIFIVFFTYFIFKGTLPNPGTLVGGLLIFTGVTLVYLFNR